jgi:hypothetical protein
MILVTGTAMNIYNSNRKIDEASNATTKRSGYAVFSPGSTSGGTWVSGL